MLLLLIASFNKLVSRISLTRPSFATAPRQSTAYSGTLLGVHFQSPRRNFGAGSMWNAPWPTSRILIGLIHGEGVRIFIGIRYPASLCRICREFPSLTWSWRSDYFPVLTGPCGGARRAWKPKSYAAVNGTKSVRTTKIQVTNARWYRCFFAHCGSTVWFIMLHSVLDLLQ